MAVINSAGKGVCRGIEHIGGSDSAKRFMRALRDTGSVDEVVKVRQIMENANSSARVAKSNTPIRFEDRGYHTGQPMDGVLDVYVGDKYYSNDWDPRKSSISKVLERAFERFEKLLPKKPTNAARRARELENKSELARLKDYRDRGLVSEKEQIQYNLGEIWKLITGKV